MNEKQTVRGRLAPSPTGYLHLGHARTFLAAWWQARKAGGELGLRLEDLDGSRARQEYRDAALEDLSWLGLDWDGPVVTQSEHLDVYEAEIGRLEANGQLFPCVCSRKDVLAAISAPHTSNNALYPGTCRGKFKNRSHAQAETGLPANLRFSGSSGIVSFTDLLQGPQSYDAPTRLGDFIVARRDGAPAYHLSVVVDDHRFRVTHVVRGDDLLESTGCHILLAEALGYPRPEWMHIPLVLDSAGNRLAKRHDALSLRALRHSGVASGAIVAWVARSLGCRVPKETTVTETLKSFVPRDIPRVPVVAPGDGPSLLRELNAYDL